MCYFAPSETVGEVLISLACVRW